MSEFINNVSSTLYEKHSKQILKVPQKISDVSFEKILWKSCFKKFLIFYTRDRVVLMQNCRTSCNFTIYVTPLQLFFRNSRKRLLIFCASWGKTCIHKFKFVTKTKTCSVHCVNSHRIKRTKLVPGQ